MLLSLIFVACDNNRVYEAYEPVSDEIWEIDEKITFDFAVKDTLSPYNLYFNVRNTGQYGYRNLFVFADTRFPDGEVYRDTIACTLADSRGQWLGSGFGNVYDLSVMFKRKVGFPVPGKYQITFKQAMRTDSLKHITDVGVRVEKAVQ